MNRLILGIIILVMCGQAYAEDDLKEINSEVSGLVILTQDYGNYYKAVNEDIKAAYWYNISTRLDRIDKEVIKLRHVVEEDKSKVIPLAHICLKKIKALIKFIVNSKVWFD